MHLTGIIESLRGLLRPVEDSAGAAVAILLRREGRDLKLLLVKRAVNPLDPWSGDMAFPGGRRHPEDGDLWGTVVRETMEETAIELAGCRFLGTLYVVASVVAPELGVLPFVFFCDDTPEIELSGELRSYLWVSLEQLRRSRGTAQVHQGTVPAYIINGVVVWGLTYRMLENLLQLLDRAAETGTV